MHRQLLANIFLKKKKIILSSGCLYFFTNIFMEVHVSYNLKGFFLIKTTYEIL